jgi:hypothetical protein
MWAVFAHHVFKSSGNFDVMKLIGRRSRNASPSGQRSQHQRRSQPADREADRLHWRDRIIGWFYVGSF